MPALSYVLVQCNIPQLLLETEYMMELLDASWLTGEGKRNTALSKGKNKLGLPKKHFKPHIVSNVTDVPNIDCNISVPYN